MLPLMPSFILLLVRLCLFQAKPQDLPAQRSVFVTLAVVAGLMLAVRNNLLLTDGTAIGIAVAQVILLGLGLKILVIIFAKSERWLQAATALYGSTALVTGLVILLLLGSGEARFADSVSNPVADSAPLFFTIITISLWYFAIIVFILRETLNLSIFVAGVLTVLLELVVAAVMLQLFGSQIL